MAKEKSNGHTNGHKRKPIKRSDLKKHPVPSQHPTENAYGHSKAQQGADYLADARRLAAKKRAEARRERELTKHAGILYDYHNERSQMYGEENRYKRTPISQRNMRKMNPQSGSEGKN